VGADVTRMPAASGGGVVANDESYDPSHE
jgi:hypothetical protein